MVLRTFRGMILCRCLPGKSLLMTLGIKVLPVESGTKRNGLSEADSDVPAKLADQRLERGEEAEALPGR